MPSRSSVAHRRKAAIESVNETLGVIADHLGIERSTVAVSGPATRDPEFRETLLTEQASEALQLIADRLINGEPAGEAEDDPTGMDDETSPESASDPEPATGHLVIVGEPGPEIISVPPKRTRSKAK